MYSKNNEWSPSFTDRVLYALLKISESIDSIAETKDSQPSYPIIVHRTVKLNQGSLVSLTSGGRKGNCLTNVILPPTLLQSLHSALSASCIVRRKSSKSSR
jgi:hypothetical protein